MIAMEPRKGILTLYGSKKFFEERHKEGYTEVSFGIGHWTIYDKILALWAFYLPEGHPNSGTIRTVEYPKAFPGKDDMNHGPPFGGAYSQPGFEEHLRTHRLRMDEPISLEEVLKSNEWPEL